MNFIGNESTQKLRGGYYTPGDLATFLCRWVLETAPLQVLEPSCGDGAFLAALRAAGAPATLAVTAIELDPVEAGKAAQRAKDAGLQAASVQAADFLGWALTESGLREPGFDAVVGNPPFVRYQYLPPAFQALAAQVFQALDLPFTRHTNAWVPFVLAALHLLRPGGRLAMVVPAEILHVMHAQSLRAFLGRECRRLVIVDPEELWFAGTLQGAVLLLAEKRGSQHHAAEGLGIHPVRNREFLRAAPADIFDRSECIHGRAVAGKWTRALLDRETRELLDELDGHPGIHRFGAVAKVDVGIVTGANQFFLVTDDVVRRHGLERWAHPMFGRSGHCPGILYDAGQHEANVRSGHPTNFLWFADETPLAHTGAKAYIQAGEARQLHTRYKCRIRSPWFAVPSVYATAVGMLKRCHDTPRLILNRTGAYTTDTAYRVRAGDGIPAELLVGCFLNALTALSAELEGRHYGGGVLELVPSEIEKLAVPLPERLAVDLDALDQRVRHQAAQDILAANSRIVLGALGIPRRQQDCLLAGWKRLRDRRQRNPDGNGEGSPVPPAAAIHLADAHG